MTLLDTVNAAFLVFIQSLLAPIVATMELVHFSVFVAVKVFAHGRRRHFALANRGSAFGREFSGDRGGGLFGVKAGGSQKSQ